jgi:hypothetical protein
VPYIYEISFDIPAERIDELQMGHSLQRVLGFLRINLPGQPGNVTSGAWYSLDDATKTRVVFFSEWANWEDLTAHRDSALFEDKVIAEFEEHIGPGDLTHRVYAEVGTEPY